MTRPFRSRGGPPKPEGGLPAIAIFGAGAIGCWVGGKLAAGGARVTLIGRPRVLDELDGGRVLVSELERTPQTAQVERATDAAACRDADIVLVTVKSAQTAEAGAAIAPHLGAHTLVASLQNGVRNAGVLERELRRGPLAPNARYSGAPRRWCSIISVPETPR